jgi:hypothetical protein
MPPIRLAARNLRGWAVHGAFCCVVVAQVATAAPSARNGVAEPGTVVLEAGAAQPAAGRSTMTHESDRRIAAPASSPAADARGSFGTDTLKPLLPAQAGPWRQVAVKPGPPGDLGQPSSTVEARYRSARREAQVTVSDLGALAALAGLQGGTPAASAPGVHETVSREGARTVVSRDGPGRRGEIHVTFANGLVIDIVSDDTGTDLLHELLRGLHVERFEALQRPPR